MKTQTEIENWLNLLNKDLETEENYHQIQRITYKISLLEWVLDKNVKKVEKEK